MKRFLSIVALVAFTSSVLALESPKQATGGSLAAKAASAPAKAASAPAKAASKK